MKTYQLKPPTDMNGKALPLFKTARENQQDKAVDQLTGICAGILSDGVVNEKEVEFLDLFKARTIPIRRYVKLRAEANPYDPGYRDYFNQRDNRKRKTGSG